MANRWFTQFFGTLHKKPVMLDCSFTVNPLDTSGSGVSNLVGGGIANVFMHTTLAFLGDTHTNNIIDGIAPAATAVLVPGMAISGAGIPVGTVITSITSTTSILISQPTTATAAGISIIYVAVGSPNPGVGYILVQFQDLYNGYYFGTEEFISPPSGTDISISGAGVLTIGQPYIITQIGTTTQAQWQAVGLPKGVAPAVGESFFASVTGLGVGTGVVQAAGKSGSSGLEVVGNPNQMLGSNFNGASILGGGAAGSYMIFQSLGFTNLIAAPVTGTTINLSFFLSNSFLKVNGD